MAKANTQLTLKVAAINAASRVFQNISSSASSTIGKIAKWAVGLGSVYLSAKAVADSFQEMGKLSDVAQAAGSGVEELTKLSGALNMLGVQGSKPEELAAAFQRMTKATGQVGVEGFHRVIAAISKLPTIQERATAATQVFGRTGLQFLPVIEGAAKNGIQHVKDLEAAIPGISQTAADAGDSFAAAMGVMKLAAVKIWNEGLMKVATLITGEFNGDVRTAALIGAAQMEYFAKAAWAYIKTFIGNTKASFLQIAEWISRIFHNLLTRLGGLIVTSVENLVTRTRGVFDNLFTGAELLFAKMHGDEAAFDYILEQNMARQKARKRQMEANWREYEKVAAGLDLKMGDGLLSVDLSGLQAQRAAAIAAAKKAGEAYRKAAIPLSPTDRAALDGARAGARGAQNVNPEALLGGTYKAVTFALRAGYASAQEKIARGVEKISGLLKGVKDNTAEMADNLNLSEV